MAQRCCPELVTDAERVVGTFKPLFELFHNCYEGYTGGVMSDEDIDELGKLHCKCITIWKLSPHRDQH